MTKYGAILSNVVASGLLWGLTMADHSEARAEAAAKALTEVLDLPEFLATDVRDADWLRRDASLIARRILAALAAGVGEQQGGQTDD